MKIIQISDTHLLADTNGLFMDIEPYKTLKAVLRCIQQGHSDAEAIIVTGDLSQDESLASYQHLKQLLLETQLPFYWLNGNHDDSVKMRKAAPEAIQKVLTYEHWQIILLNTQRQNVSYGYLTNVELEFLRVQLTACNKQTLIAMHHNPAPIHSEWMDKIMLHNNKALLELLQNYSHVKGIIHGHVHQEKIYQWHQLPIFATPATSAQFTPSTLSLEPDQLKAGFRVLTLENTGHIQSTVYRID